MSDTRTKKQLTLRQTIERRIRHYEGIIKNAITDTDTAKGSVEGLKCVVQHLKNDLENSKD